MAQEPLSVLDTLNPEQRAAVLHRGGPLLVLAGAGTGKTLTLAARVAQRVLDGADPNRLLLLTFSRRAAQALSQRAGRQVQQALGLRSSSPDGAAPLLPWSGTFHAVAARLLRDYAPRIGLAPQFSIVDRADAESLMGLARERLGLAQANVGGQAAAQARGGRRFALPATCLAIHSRCLNTQAPLGQVLATQYPWCLDAHDALTALFRAYAQDKHAQATLDYDDLLLGWQRLLAEPTLAAHLRARFDEVFVDEYQDTNRLQAAILRGLRPDGSGLTVVGDDAQSIYAFRGAEVGNILGFAQQFEPPARVVALQRNYRSTQPILDCANALIAEAPGHPDKHLHTERTESARPQLVTVADELDQARSVADQALAWREEGLRLKQQAVLFRTSTHSAALEFELARRNIPFVKFGGLKFLEAAHIKDLLSVLRWAHNPRARLAGWRVVQRVPGIGAVSARRLLDAMDAAPEPLAALQAWQPPPAARAEWPALVQLMAGLARPDSPWPGELGRVRDWLAPHLERLHPEDHTLRLADLDQLQALAAGTRHRERFLTDLTLDPPEATSDESGVPHRDEDYLILSTLHSAKGQEWSAVQILNVVDGCLPSDLSTGSAGEIEEERRLLYVGITRARRHLRLMAPLRFHVTQQHRHGDRHLYGNVSRFVTRRVMATLERLAPAAAPADAAGADLAGLPDGALDLGAALRNTWS
ncbi:ATP-dependent helicase [Aquabacterium sp. OR-4]|nr:ATP-dependent helicase [Aquabacterium sp. OR-4]MDT7834361.1 ATP-dependent helicase [Aquabacterium sp. OR-4]